MFKKPLYFLIFLLVTVHGTTFSEEKITVYIKVEGFKNNIGLCYLLLFKNRNGFPDSIDHSNIKLSKSVEQKSVEFKVSLIPGTYAVSILHDENLNEKLDKTWYGKPVEGIGLSNNPTISFGPPGFKESTVSLREDKSTLKIIMKYF